MWGQIISLSIASAMISFIIADAKIFLWWREFLKPRSKFFYGLFSCGLCTGTWIALFLTLIFYSHLSIEWIIITWFDVAYGSALFWIILVLLINKSGK